MDSRIGVDARATRLWCATTHHGVAVHFVGFLLPSALDQTRCGSRGRVQGQGTKIGREFNGQLTAV